MENNKLWVGHILKYGAILGFSLCLIEFFALYLGMIFSPYMGLIYIVFTELILMITIRRYRDFIQKGYINFLYAFLTGLFVSLFAGVIWAVYRYFQYILVPGITEEIHNSVILTIKESGRKIPQDELTKTWLNFYTSPFFLSFFKTFIFNMGVGGTILSLFLASVLKRKPLNNNLD